MSTQRFKLTKTAKVLIFVLVLAILCGCSFFAINKGLIKMPEKKTEKVAKDNGTKDKVVKNDTVDDENTINISLDEWIGWKEIIDSNGGLTTQKGSIFDNLGIKVNISVINDATQSSNAIISGDLDGAGYTINRMAFLSKKFSDAGKEVVCPYITNFSNGGDGIIATNKIQTVEDLVDAKIGVPEFSEAQTIVVWFVNQSDLTQNQKDTIINNLIMFATPDEVANAFFAGQLDVAATWQPYLSQASSTDNTHILFDTSSSTKLVMDGIVFDKEFAESHKVLISKFINGCLQASSMYDNEFNYIREAMPMFNGMSDEDIKASTQDAALTTWKNNIDLLGNGAKTVFSNMCDVWKSIGEAVDDTLVYTLFDGSYVTSLASTYKNDTTDNTPKVVVNDSNKQEIIDKTAILTKRASIEFVARTANFLDVNEADSILQEFLEIGQTLDGMCLQIEGNIDSATYSTDSPLSQQRASTVAQWFISNGISADRIITIGNGSSKPVASRDTEEGKAANRRTDISFKIVQ